MTDEQRKKLRQAVFSWWQRLHPDDEGGHGDRAAAAQLRRAATPNDVIVVQEAMRLHRDLCEAVDCSQMSAERFERFSNAVAIIAGVLAGVRPGEKPVYIPFAEMLGRHENGERPLFSPLRFAALVRSDEPEERLRHLRRAVAVADRRGFDVARFAEDMLRWDDETRRRWIFQYHQRAHAAPAATERTELEGTAQ